MHDLASPHRRDRRSATARCNVGPCTSADPLADLSDAPLLTYTVSGPVGTFNLTCMIPGGLSKTIAVTLD